MHVLKDFFSIFLKFFYIKVNCMGGGPKFVGIGSWACESPKLISVESSSIFTNLTCRGDKILD